MFQWQKVRLFKWLWNLCAFLFIYCSTHRTAEWLTDLEGNWRSPYSNLRKGYFNFSKEAYRSIFPRNCTWKKENRNSWVVETWLSHTYHLLIDIIASTQMAAKMVKTKEETYRFLKTSRECLQLEKWRGKNQKEEIILTFQTILAKCEKKQFKQRLILFLNLNTLVEQEIDIDRTCLWEMLF